MKTSDSEGSRPPTMFLCDSDFTFFKLFSRFSNSGGGGRTLCNPDSDGILQHLQSASRVVLCLIIMTRDTDLSRVGTNSVRYPNNLVKIY